MVAVGVAGALPFQALGFDYFTLSTLGMAARVDRCCTSTLGFSYVLCKVALKSRVVTSLGTDKALAYLSLILKRKPKAPCVTN